MSYTTDVYRECTLAKTLGMQLRLVSGFKGDLKTAPACIVSEYHRGVPGYLLGFSALQCPRIVRYLLLLESPLPLREADLVASHLREFAKQAQELEIECTSRSAYVGSEKSGRDFRRQIAEKVGVPPASVKKLMNAVGYGGSGEAPVAV